MTNFDPQYLHSVYFFQAQCTQEKEDLKNRLTASHKYMFDLLATALFLDPAVVEGFLLTTPSVSFTHKLITDSYKSTNAVAVVNYFCFCTVDLNK